MDPIGQLLAGTHIAGVGSTPVYRSHSEAVSASATTLDIAYPTGLAADDILILIVNHSTTGSVLTTPAGFTQIGTTQDYATDALGYGLHGAVFWKRADGTETGNLSLARSSADSASIFYGVLAAYSGCIASGNPVEGVTEVIDATSPYTMSSVTTLGANRRVLCAGTVKENRARNSGPATGWDNRAALINGTGTDGTIFLDDEEQVAAGSPTDDFFGTPGSEGSAIFAFALKPVGA